MDAVNTEKRLISADVAKEMIVNHANEFSDVLNRREKALLIGGATSCIDKCPTVDAVEVVHGRWVNVIDYGGFCVGFCSVCDTDQKAGNATALRAHHRHCRWCGAKMDGDGNGNL